MKLNQAHVETKLVTAQYNTIHMDRRMAKEPDGAELLHWHALCCARPFACTNGPLADGTPCCNPERLKLNNRHVGACGNTPIVVTAHLRWGVCNGLSLWRRQQSCACVMHIALDTQNKLWQWLNTGLGFASCAGKVKLRTVSNVQLRTWNNRSVRIGSRSAALMLDTTSAA